MNNLLLGSIPQALLKPVKQGVQASVFFSLLLANLVWAEQFQTFGNDQVHYVVVPSEFIDAAVAAQYGIVRGANRSFLNISVLRDGTDPQAAQVKGHATNLLGQRLPLEFREVREGPAIYYIAEFKHTDEDYLKFDIQLVIGERPAFDLQFRQKIYLDN